MAGNAQVGQGSRQGFFCFFFFLFLCMVAQEGHSKLQLYLRCRELYFHDVVIFLALSPGYFGVKICDFERATTSQLLLPPPAVSNICVSENELESPFSDYLCDFAPRIQNLNTLHVPISVHHIGQLIEEDS